MSGRVERDPDITLMVETSKGVFMRRILPASVLPEHIDRGPAAEAATKNAAALWGLPDFVFRSGLARRGSAVREVGDAIVVVGDRAACVQVKARSAPSGDLDRERAWLDKKIAEGARQSAGTIRSMQGAPRSLTNERGGTVMLNGAQKTWVAVIVVEHPGLDGYVPTTTPVVLLRRDWEFLFEQLKSSYAVLEYLGRVSRLRPVELGTEPVRYYQLAAADLNAPKGTLDPRLAALGGQPYSVPLLPMEPARHGEVIRIMLEDIAESPLPDDATRSDVLDVLAAIDAAPVGYRAELGNDVLRWLGAMADVAADEVRWQFRKISWPQRPHLIFGAASHFSAIVREAFGSLISLRHQQYLDLMPERSHVMTVGVLLTPRHDGRRLWDTTMVATRGDQGLDPPFRAALEGLWGSYEAGDRRERATEPHSATSSLQ